MADEFGYVFESRDESGEVLGLDSGMGLLQ